MEIKFFCPNCSTKLSAETTLGGEETRCPKCGAAITVPAVSLGPGVTLGGCRIERRIGHGGMGDVFLAEQLSMRRKVALKILSPSFAASFDVIHRFQHEVRILARLNHPNIVTALEAGTDQGYHYLVMSYVDGEAMDRIIAARSTISEREALAVAIEIAGALDYAWERYQVIHRDIKPGNIMIDRKDQVWLMDLGIGKSLGATGTLTATGKALGSPHYMSPEQAAGQADADFRSDIYSLGVTTFHMVTGQTPFTGATLNEIIASHIHSPTPLARVRNPTVSEPCEQLLQVMMAKRPEQRQQTWSRVIADLKRVAAGRAPLTPAPAPAGQHAQGAEPTSETAANARTRNRGGDLLRLVGRNPAACVTIAAVLLLVAIVCARFVMPQRPSHVNLRPEHTSAAPPFPPPRAAHAPEADETAEPVNTTVEVVAPQPEQPFIQDADSQDAVEAVSVTEPPLETPAGSPKPSGHDSLDMSPDYDAPGTTEQGTDPHREEPPPMAMDAPANEPVPGSAVADVADDVTPDDVVPARQRLHQLARTLANDLVENRPSRAWGRLREAKADAEFTPVAGQLHDMALWVVGVGRTPELIRRTFEEDAGKEITVSFKRGKERVKIRSVAGPQIQALRYVRSRGMSGGYFGFSFQVSDLSDTEKKTRLARSTSSRLEVARGLAEAGSGDLKQAVLHLSGAGPLGAALIGRLTGKSPDRVAPLASPEDIPDPPSEE